MTDINATSASSLSSILNDINMGPTSSVQFMFAKLQLAQSQICKTQAESYMKQIESIQEEQKKTSDMISRARALQNEAKTSGSSTEMPADMVAFFKERGLTYDTDGGDNKHTQAQWDVNIKSLTDYQESIGNKTQTLMVYLQDFISQYNSYLQGASSQISTANQTLTNVARGQ